MNAFKLELTAKARHLCFLLPLCMSLVWARVPGPCRHSVTKDHLLSLSRLIDNQLDNGCLIVYSFTERQSLSKVCYVKAAFPQILELLNTHFNYAKNSDNQKYVNTLKRVLYNLYSQRCIPEINEEIEDVPMRFTKVLHSSPKEALRNAQGVIETYMVLLQQQASPVDWNCQDEYTAVGDEEQPASTTATDAVATGLPECQCSCPKFPEATTLSYSAHSWNTLKQPEPTALPSCFTHHPHLGKFHSDAALSTATIDKDTLTASHLKTTAMTDSQPFEKRESSDVPQTPFDISYLTNANSMPLRSPVPMDKTDGQADKDFMYSSTGRGTESSTTEPYVLSDNADVTPALYLTDVAQRNFSSIGTVLAKAPLIANNFERQHQYGTASLGREEVQSGDNYESKAIKGVHRVTSNSTNNDNRDTRRKNRMAITHDRALKRRGRYPKKSRIIPRDLRAQAKDILSTAWTSEWEDSRTAHKDSSTTGDPHLLYLCECQVVQAVFTWAVVSAGMLLVLLFCVLASNRRVGRSENWSRLMDD